MTHTRSVSFGVRAQSLLTIAIVLAGLCVASRSEAQIKQPGAHPHYSVELEPHLALWWSDNYHYHYDYYNGWDDGTGLGLGLRASIPLVDNGFISSINNNVAIGFGLDWGHWGHECGWWGGNRWYYGNGDCTNNVFYFPVVMQWNFFITKVFSVFGEPGLAIFHSRTSADAPCNPAAPNGAWCSATHSHTDIDPVFFVGGRVGGEKVAFTFRLGWPYISLGASFFL